MGQATMQFIKIQHLLAAVAQELLAQMVLEMKLKSSQKQHIILKPVVIGYNKK